MSNDERNANDERMPKSESRNAKATRAGFWPFVLGAAFVIQISSFGIFLSGVSDP
jgi:hypothetical protein